MTRKPPPPVQISMDRAQKMATARPMTADGQRLAGAREVPIDQVLPDLDQPRRDWDHDQGVLRQGELAASIKEFGVLQPLLVREDGALDDGRTRYVIIAGGRRRAAAELAGVATLPVVVRDEEGGRVRVLQLIENIQRQALAPLDEARAYKEIIDAEGLSAEALGERLHVSGQQIRERLRLLADQVLADAVERGQIAPSVARSVQRLPDAEREALRGRVEGGEALQLAQVHDVKARSVAAGVENPRAKGGGRRSQRAQPDQAVLDLQKGRQDQALLDPDVVQGLYEAFKGWETQVSQLTPHDLRRLVGLIRGDMQNLIASITEMTSHAQEQMH